MLLAVLDLRRWTNTSAPRGWHHIRTDTAGPRSLRLGLALYYHVAAGHEPSGYRWRFGRRSGAVGGVLAYRGVSTRAPISSSSGHGARTRATIHAPALQSVSPGGLVVGLFAHAGPQAITTPSGLAQRLDRRGGGRHSSVRLTAADGAAGPGSQTATRSGPVGPGIGQLVALRPGTGAPPPPPSSPCAGTSASAGYQHVVWILFENHSYNQVIGSSSAPYFNGLAHKCGLATNYSAVSHPSLPNYIALTSGSTQGITNDSGPSSHPLNVPSIFSQLPGGASRSLDESMPSNCALSDSGKYAVRHNPETYYTNVRSDCNSLDTPLGSPPNISARFTFVTPNLCSDMHDCSVATGDSWLASFLPTVLSSSPYRSGRTVVFVTFDEGSGDNHVVTLVIAPSVRPGAQSGTAYTHYSLLRTTEELLGLGLLGNASGAPSMRAAFGL